MSFLMTFLEGFLSFVSPCILPMVPIYLIYMSAEKRSPLVSSIGFALGFSTVFVTLGVSAGSVGAALTAHKTAVSLACAALIAIFGLTFIFDIPLPLKGITSKNKVHPTGFIKAFLFGIVFSICLTPCVGAFLGAALMIAASEGGALKGATLLAVYSLGLAIPFVLSALMINRLKNFFSLFKAHARSVSVCSGVILLGFAGCTAAQTLLPDTTPADKADIQGGRNETQPSNNNSTAAHKNDAAPAAAPIEVAITADNFETEVLKSNLPAVVDFWAPWCGPCRMLAPHLKAIAEANKGTIKVCKVNVDNNAALSERFGITGIPTIYVFKDGKVISHFVGYRDKAELESLILTAIGRK